MRELTADEKVCVKHIGTYLEKWEEKKDPEDGFSFLFFLDLLNVLSPELINGKS